MEESWLYDRLKCLRLGHFTRGSKTIVGPMSFREASRWVMHAIFNKKEGKDVNLLLCKSKCVKHFRVWGDKIERFQTEGSRNNFSTISAFHTMANSRTIGDLCF